MTIDYQIKDKKMKYNTNREPAKLAAWSPVKIDKYE